jgi:hypothetical protein
MLHDKKQIIRSMKSYSEGGESSECVAGTPGCGYNKAKRKNKRRATMRKIGEGAGKVVGAVLGLGTAAGAGYALKKGLEQQKRGGAVKAKAVKKAAPVRKMSIKKK